jgi:hypothetical protein
MKPCSKLIAPGSPPCDRGEPGALDPREAADGSSPTTARYLPHMHIAFALFADAANISQEGKLNVLGVFDAVHVGTLPAVHPRATLVVRLKGGSDDAGQHAVTLRWISPSGRELWQSTAELNVGAPPPGSGEMDIPLIASVDLPVEQAGEHMMAIALDGLAVTDVRLFVHAAIKLPNLAAGTLLS